MNFFNQYKPVVDFFGAFLAPIIGIAVVYIAYQQHRTYQTELKFKLYERRLHVYQTVKKFIGSAIRNGNLSHEDLQSFWFSVAEGDFLFGDEITGYVKLLFQKGADFQLANCRLDKLDEVEERRRVNQERSKCFGWFSEQFDNSAQLFKKYLAIR